MYQFGIQTRGYVLNVGENEFKFIFVHFICQQVSSIMPQMHAERREETKWSSSGLFAVSAYLIFIWLPDLKTHDMVFTEQASHILLFSYSLDCLAAWLMCVMSELARIRDAWFIGSVMHPLFMSLHRIWESWLWRHMNQTKYWGWIMFCSYMRGAQSVL